MVGGIHIYISLLYCRLFIILHFYSMMVLYILWVVLYTPPSFIVELVFMVASWHYLTCHNSPSVFALCWNYFCGWIFAAFITLFIDWHCRYMLIFQYHLCCGGFMVGSIISCIALALVSCNVFLDGLYCWFYLFVGIHVLPDTGDTTCTFDLYSRWYGFDELCYITVPIYLFSRLIVYYSRPLFSV